MIKILSVFAVYPSRPAVEEAVTALRRAGFRSTDISALLPEKSDRSDRLTPGKKNPDPEEKSTKTPEGTVTGAASGAALGGVLGWLAGIGAIAIPGAEALIAAGPMIGMLAGVGAAGVVGGVVGALVGIGIPESEAGKFEQHIQGGGILLSVHCDDMDWAKRAEQILKDSGGEDVVRST